MSLPGFHDRRVIRAGEPDQQRMFRFIQTAWKIEQATLTGVAMRHEESAAQLHGHPRGGIRKAVRRVGGLGKAKPVAPAVDVIGTLGHVRAQARQRENARTDVLRVEAFQNRMRQLFGRRGVGA